MAVQYYRLNFNIMKSDIVDISLTELEDMLPYEREIYVSLFIEEKQKRDQANGN